LRDGSNERERRERRWGQAYNLNVAHRGGF
jgi:hypothetical protein